MATNNDNNEMHSFSARLNTFHIPHQLSKRRASSQSIKKKVGGGGNTLEWPHERPSAEDLARAGFFYAPAQESPDNVKCFFCAVKLDGWEADDDPVREHLAHSGDCYWARCLLAGREAQNKLSRQETRDGDVAHSENHDDGKESGLQNPLSQDLAAARNATFTSGTGWPHENKRGWKCKIAKMVEAGWCFDPAPSTAGDTAVGGDGDGDGVSCFYCDLALDGWEPKDDPYEEHRRRSPECAFFTLVQKFGGMKKAAAGKAAKGKGKGGAKGGRSSTASKVSRLSTQSAVSTFSEPPSLADLGEDAVEVGVDDSVLSTASQATATGTTTTKGKKKAGRAKAAGKGAKGRKRANTMEAEVETEPLYPDLSLHGVVSQHMAEEGEAGAGSSQPGVDAGGFAAAAPPQTKKQPRKGTRASKQPLDSSVVEISSLDVAAGGTKKSTRGRKPKARAAAASEPMEPNAGGDAEVDAEADHSEVSAQLQEELERSMDFDAVADDDNTPQPQAPPAQAKGKGKRGVKRTSDGLRKEESADVVGVVLDEFPQPPALPPRQTASQAKGKKGRKPSKQVDKADDDDIAMSESEPEEPSKPTKTKKAPAKKAGGNKGRKASSTRSSKATIIAAEPAFTITQPDDEDLEQDEREIEAELQRIADEQQQRGHQIQVEQEKEAEFEPSPHHARKHVEEIRILEGELRAEVESLDRVEGGNLERFVAKVAASSPPPAPSRGLGVMGEVEGEVKEEVKGMGMETEKNATPSPNGSDKENVPSSVIQPSLHAKQEQKQQPAPLLSPTKTTRIPLAPSTPNRQLYSPSKPRISPTKPLAAITSTVPWEPIDIESVLFMPSPQATPGTLAQRLEAVATAAAGGSGRGGMGGLSVEERGLTVEEWIRYRAGVGEEELRRGCEGMVAAFEREGLRALESLRGIAVVE